MYVLAQIAPAVGCALIMVICLISMGAVSGWKRRRARHARGGELSGDPVDGLRAEVASLQEALEARDRSGSQS